MKHFTIENETNNITLYATAKEADAVPNSERFGHEAALAKLAASWPAARLVEIWNTLPGETPVKKFKDRATAVSRIWKAVQSLGQAEPATAEASPARRPAAALSATAPAPRQDTSETTRPDVVGPAPAETAVSTQVAPQSPHVAPETAPAKKKATRTKKAPVAATNAGTPREGSKTSQVIAMLRREGGATLEEIMTMMTWQKHTTRAMLSAGGSLTKKHGLVITSAKVDDKRLYSINA